MNSAGRAAVPGLFFLFVCILISPLCADTLSGDESPPGEELPLSEEDLPGGESPLGEELLLSEEALPGDESPPGEELLLSEEDLPGDESPPGEDLLLSEEDLPRDESPSDEDLFLSEDPFLDDDDDSLFFEAPPLVFEIPTFIFEPRSFDAIFPGFSEDDKTMAMSGAGLKYSFEKDGSPMLVPDPGSGIDLFSSVMRKNPSHIIEILTVVPYNERELDMLDVYNAMGRIENIKNYTMRLRGQDFNIFVETSRLESARKRKDISDPPPADRLPYSETMYIRLKEAFFGNLFLRGDVSMSLYGITYSLTNFTDVRYLILPIMKAGRFSAIIYLEPLKEGVLIYSMSGLYLPGFIADRVNLTPSINSRIGVLISWLTDSLRRQGSVAAQRENREP